MPTRVPSSFLLLLLGAFLTACATAKDSERPGDTARASADAPAAPGNDTLAARADSSRILGSPNARVWLVMVSDFECPYCKVWHDSTFADVRKEYVATGKVRMAYVHLPMPSHRNAFPAAETAMCAGVQGKFWEMHDAIFDTQAAWSRMTSAAPLFDSLGVKLGLDMARQRACLEQRATRALVQADLDRSVAAGITSTPNFLIGGLKLEGAHPIVSMRRAIDAALAAPSPSPATP